MAGYQVRIVAQLVSVDEFGGSTVKSERTALTLHATDASGMSLRGVVRAVRDAIDVDALLDLDERNVVAAHVAEQDAAGDAISREHDEQSDERYAAEGDDK